MTSTLHVVVPGPLEQRTGGYLYDARMVHGLRARGWTVVVHNLDGRFPDGDEEARTALAHTLTSLPDGARVVVDGLAMSGLPDTIEPHASRLHLVGLVHHALADETGISPEDRLRYLRTERAALASCAGVIVTSTYTAHRLADFDVPADRIRAVPPGTQPAARATGPGPGADPILLCVATVTRRKGHDVLVDALFRVKDLPWHCVCAGSLERDLPWVDQIRERVSRHGLTDRVDFVGEHPAEALEDFYRTASVFVLASHYEGYGMALAEALARGLPIVSTTGGAIPFTVPDDAGLLVSPGDTDAFASALRDVLQPERRDTLAAAALERGLALPDWETSIEAFERAVVELAPA